MFRRFCSNGEQEILKGAFHAAGIALAGMMAVYNATAWCYRRERHLRVNALVYTLAALWEVKQTARHFGKLDAVCSREQPLTLVEKSGEAA